MDSTTTRTSNSQSSKKWCSNNWWGENIHIANGIRNDLLQQQQKQQQQQQKQDDDIISSCFVWPPLLYMKPLDMLIVASNTNDNDNSTITSSEVSIGSNVTHYMSRTDTKRLRTSVVNDEVEEESKSGSSSTTKKISLGTCTLQNLLESCFGIITSSKDNHKEEGILSYKHVETEQVHLRKTVNVEDDDDDEDENEEETMEQIIENSLEGMEFGNHDNNNKKIQRIYVVTSVTSALAINLLLKHQQQEQHEYTNKIDLLEWYSNKIGINNKPPLSISSTSIKITKQRHVPVTVAIQVIPFHIVNGRLQKLRNNVVAGGSKRNILNTLNDLNTFCYYHEQLLNDLLCCTNISSSNSSSSSNIHTSSSLSPTLMKRPPLVSSSSVPSLSSSNQRGSNNNINHFVSSGVSSTFSSFKIIKQALLIGNNGYHNNKKTMPNSSISSLRGCHNDVKLMNQFLSRQGYSIDMKFDLTFDNIMGSLASLALENNAALLSLSSSNRNSSSSKETSSIIVLYFSGYGRRRRINDVNDPITGCIEYEDTFVPIDSCYHSSSNNNNYKVEDKVEDNKNSNSDLPADSSTAVKTEEEKEEEGEENITNENSNDNNNSNSLIQEPNKDISLELLKDWVNQNFHNTHVMIIWDCGGSSSDGTSIKEDPDTNRIQSRVLPSDDRPPSKQNRPHAIIGAPSINSSSSSNSSNADGDEQKKTLGETTTIKRNNNNNNIVVIKSCRVNETSYEVAMEDRHETQQPKSVVASTATTSSTSQQGVCSGSPTRLWNGVMTKYLLHKIFQKDSIYRDIHYKYFKDLLNHITQTNMLMVLVSSNNTTTQEVEAQEQHLQISSSSSSLSLLLSTLLYTPIKHDKEANSPKIKLKELRLTAQATHRLSPTVLAQSRTRVVTRGHITASPLPPPPSMPQIK